LETQLIVSNAHLIDFDWWLRNPN